MAHLHNYPRNRKQTSFRSSIGNKIKNGLEFAGTVKGLYDVGRTIYQGVSTYGPIFSSSLKTIGPVVSTAALL